MNKQKALGKRIAVLDIHSPLYLRSKKNKKAAGCIEDLYSVIDKAAEAGFSAIQMLPIQDTGLLPSPYMGRSIFSYNPICYSGAREASSHNEVVDYRSLYKQRSAVLEKEASKIEVDLSSFTKNEIAYALFCHFYDIYRSRWPKWPVTIRHGQVDKILDRYPQLKEQIKIILAKQKILFQEWQAVIDYAKKRHIEFILDKPIYPLHNSAEVWANQQLFYLNQDGTLKYASGCNNPRDPFGAQYWGHAVYQFKEKPQEVIDYFIEQIRFMSKISKIIRLDHTLALIWKYYMIDPETKTGRHVRAIKHKLFDRLVTEFPNVYFIAEDLGYINEKAIDEPLRAHGIPGMRCLEWYRFAKYAKISDYPKLSVSITSNHDLETLPSWWKKLRKERKKLITRQLREGLTSDFDNQIYQIIDLVFSSQSEISTVTLMDLTMDLRRYNHPGSKNHLDWRLRMPKEIESADWNRIRRIIADNKRN